ncbi:MAG: chemotaxis protein CheA [Firmicutes bacterium HGW-Firmicutes-12]|nr:MAG: chemotaxis protein CheA [Firmicutes bacterium HGW-Firmicutes-12]
MDMSQYQDLFFEESEEHLQILNQNLLALEINPERLELLDSIFRAAHTLKGMSATMGFDSIAKLTHEMENLLDQLRERKLALSEGIINSLFKAADLLENMLESLRAGETIEIDLVKLAAEVFNSNNENLQVDGDEVRKSNNSSKKKVDASNFDNGNEFNEYERHLLTEAFKKGLNVWKITIQIEETCVMKGVRAFMVFRNLEAIGDVIKSTPPVQDIEDEKFENEFMVYLVSDKMENEVKNELISISEIIMMEIKMIILGQENSKEKENIEVKKEHPDEADSFISTQQEKKQKVHQTVRVDITRLDKLMSLVGELVINKTRLEQINTDCQIVSLNDTVEQINRITADLQTVVQNVRMVAIEQVFNRFPRMVRDLAKELGKEVNLILEGKETELDRTVIDEISDPLVHLIRNSLDHGLESPEERIAIKKNPEGQLKLQAKQEGNQVIIIVEDDGKGIDVETIKRKAIENNLIAQTQVDTLEEQSIINLIFEPGFSTANKVTDLSGRGVGLDVVRSKINSLSGQVYVETKNGKGTRFVIKLPLTLAIIQALMVRVQEELFAIPLANIDETTSLEMSQIKDVQGQQVVVLRGKVLPLFFLRDILSVPGEEKEESMYVVVVRKGEQQIGIVVDELVGQQETVINTLGKVLSGMTGIAGATILGDGSVSLIIDIGTLF